MSKLMIASLLSLGLLLAACERKADSPATNPKSGGGPSDKSAHDHKPGDAHDHGTAGDKHDGHSGKTIDLGEVTVDGMKIKAVRDAVALKAGGDTPVDVWIDGGVGNAASVRFWIGSQDAKGSVKAKAEVEAGKWHTHAEVPDPLPEGSKLWVEIEGKDGKKSVASFELKR